MPIYQFFCYKCYYSQEVQMSLAVLEEYDKGKKDISCPVKNKDGKVCGEALTKIICPPKVVKVF